MGNPASKRQTFTEARKRSNTECRRQNKMFMNLVRGQLPCIVSEKTCTYPAAAGWRSGAELPNLSSQRGELQGRGEGSGSLVRGGRCRRLSVAPSK